MLALSPRHRAQGLRAGDGVVCRYRNQIHSVCPSLPPSRPGLAWLCPESHPGTRGRSVGQMERRCREWLACGWGLEERRNVGRTCGGVGGTGSRWIGSRFGMERGRARIWGVGDGAWGFLHKQRGQGRDARPGECSQQRHTPCVTDSSP